MYNYVIKHHMPDVTDPKASRVRDLTIDFESQVSKKSKPAAVEEPKKRRNEKYGFGSSVVKAVSEQTQKTGPAGKLLKPETFKKPKTNQTFGAYVKQLKEAYDKGNFVEVKKKSEKALNENLFGEQVPLPSLHLICAKANYELGYFPFAEALAKRVLTYDDAASIVEATWLIAMSYRA